MKRLLLIILNLLLVCPSTLRAIPAYPCKKTLRKADGKLITLKLVGDEHLSYYRADDGSAMRQLSDGTWQMIAHDELEQMRQDANERRNKSNARRGNRRKARRANTLNGTRRGLVILMQFSDRSFTVANPKEYFTKFFNGENFHDNGMTGSVHEYFSQQSYGKFDLQFDVVGPFTTQKTMKYYGANSGSSKDGNVQDMVEEAVKAANAEVNFKDYDWDENGEVDQVFLIYAGYGENYGADSNCIWPHESSIDYKDIYLDGVKIATYGCGCELKGTSGSTIEGIGTACHEFSHCMGLMDHYDTGNSYNYAMGSWDLMCSGNYNGGSLTPASYTAYERWVSGWLEPVEVNSMKEVKNMKPLTDAPEAYILYNDANRNEYYLLENRQKKGFDAALAGHGLLVVHVDYNESDWANNTINNIASRQRMTIIPADNVASRDTEGADPFPGTKNVRSLADYTTAAAITYNANTDGAYLLHKAIENITEQSDGTLSFTLCRPRLTTPQLSQKESSANSATVTWPAVEEATLYKIEMEETPSKGTPETARLLEETFKGAYKSTNGLSDISTKINSYLDNSGFSGSKLYQSPQYLRLGTSTEAGLLKTPVQGALSTGELTVVMTMAPLTEGTAAQGSVSIVTNNQPLNANSFSVSTKQTFILHPDILLNEVFRVDIEAKSRMFISYLALYDGSFTAEELGLSQATEIKKASSMKAREVSPVRRKISTQEMTTTTPSYTFTDLTPSSTYRIRVRALDNERIGGWSDYLTLSLSATDIHAPQAEKRPASTDTGKLYDLSGRSCSAATRPGIYIRGGKKFVVK